MLMLLAAFGGSVSAEPLDFQPLALIHDWQPYPGARVPAVAIDSNGVVHLRGAITQLTGTDPDAFRLPKRYRPNGLVYVGVDLANGLPGRLIINLDGMVEVQSPDDYADAQLFTSLEGVKFSKQ